jgi:hypothetical protein
VATSFESAAGVCAGAAAAACEAAAGVCDGADDGGVIGAEAGGKDAGGGGGGGAIRGLVCACALMINPALKAIVTAKTTLWITLNCVISQLLIDEILRD